LAYSPERVMIGRAVKDIEERYPKIVAGIGPRSTSIVKTLYSLIASRGIIVMSSPRAAELEKLVEGAYRDVNIALANEVWRLCNELGVDYSEVLRATNSQPYCHLHKPGIGVGGLCIPIYPYFLMWRAKKLGIKLKLVETARRVNEEQPEYILQLTKSAIRSLNLGPNAKIVIMGLAYRGDIGDARMSPTYKLIDLLVGEGFKNIVVHDPRIQFDKEIASRGVPLSSSLKDALNGADVVIVATDHSEYRKLSRSYLESLTGKRSFILIDTKQLISS
ncbi:MAG: nucleotide sugar dehydrogenase, partial [Thermoprotei archaeon]